VAEVESNSKQLMMIWQTLENKSPSENCADVYLPCQFNHLHTIAGKHKKYCLPWRIF